MEILTAPSGQELEKMLERIRCWGHDASWKCGRPVNQPVYVFGKDATALILVVITLPTKWDQIQESSASRVNIC